MDRKYSSTLLSCAQEPKGTPMTSAPGILSVPLSAGGKDTVLLVALE